MNAGIAQRVRGFNFVSSVTPFRAQFKLGADLRRDSATNVYMIRLERGSNFRVVRALIAQTGAQVLAFENDTLIVAANGAFVDAIAAVDDVASINNFAMNETLLSRAEGPAKNDTARDIIGAIAANLRGYDGSTQIAAVADAAWAAGQPPRRTQTSRRVESSPSTIGPARQADVSNPSQTMVRLMWIPVTERIHQVRY